MLGNLMAIICANLLNQFGKRHARYSDKGRLSNADKGISTNPIDASSGHDGTYCRRGHDRDLFIYVWNTRA